jgi:DNA polymerase-3 subunit delta'
MPPRKPREIRQEPVAPKKTRVIELIGHGKEMALLRHSFESGRLAHAYLFVGSVGIGKLALAREAARLALGAETPLERHPDFCQVERGRDPKTGKLHADIVLDQIHELRGWLSRAAMLGGWKAAVIDGADRLNKEAANALLKSLEEPQGRAVILLTAGSTDEVEPTIRSRCQIFRLGRVPEAEIAAALKAKGTRDETAELCARMAGGRPSTAVRYALEPGVLDEMRRRREPLLAVPGAALSDRWKTLEALVPDGMSFNEAAEDVLASLDMLSELLRDALLIAAGRGDCAAHADASDRLAAWSSALGYDGLASALEEVIEAKRAVGENANLRAVMGRVALAFEPMANGSRSC